MHLMDELSSICKSCNRTMGRALASLHAAAASSTEKTFEFFCWPSAGALAEDPAGDRQMSPLVQVYIEAYGDLIRPHKLRMLR